MYKSNPYNNVGGINDPDLFFNRRGLLLKVMNNLFTNRPQCISIVGQRKIGKTSFACQVTSRNVIEKLGFSAKNYIFIRFDCQENIGALKSINSIYQELTNQLLKSLPSSDKKNLSFSVPTNGNETPITVWRSCLETLTKQGYYTIPVFDEFEVAIYSEPLFREGFFEMERGYANNPNNNYKWVTCTPLPLAYHFSEASRRYNINESGSEFSALALPYHISLFSAADINELIDQPSQKNEVVFTDEEKQAILDFGGRYPYFVQRACYHFFDAYIYQERNIKVIQRRCKSEAIPIWEGFWTNLDVPSKDALVKIACEQNCCNLDGNILSDLESSSLIYQGENDEYYLFSNKFSEFIREKRERREFIISPGQRIDNSRYLIKDSIASTKNNQLVTAWDNRWERLKTIKLVRTDPNIDDERRNGLQLILIREAKILFDVHHPYIGKVYDIIFDPVSIVMEWIEGKSLQYIIDKKEKLTGEEIVRIGIEIFDALDYLHCHHREQIIHRDIKPSNIIYTPARISKLIDFGIARDSAFETLSRGDNGTPNYLGSPDYSAPEQLTSSDASPYWDIFSLGVILYELFTFQKPYKYGNLLTLYKDNHFPEPSPFDIPKPIYDVLFIALSEKPTERSSAAQLRNMLKNCL